MAVFFMWQNETQDRRTEGKITEDSPASLGEQEKLSGLQAAGSKSIESPEIQNRPDQSKSDFDLRVTQYTEDLKTELIKNTPRCANSGYQWMPYRLNLSHIQQEFHERIAHHLLQSHDLPEVARHVAYNAQEFKGINVTALANALIALGENGLAALGENLPNFQGVEEALLLETFLKNDVLNLLSNWEVFSKDAQRHLVRVVTSNADISFLVQNWDTLRLSNEELKGVVEDIFSRGALNIAQLPKVIFKLRDINQEEMLCRVIAHGVEGSRNVALNLHRYQAISPAIFAQACRELCRDCCRPSNEIKEIESLISFFEEFSGLTEHERAMQLLRIAPEQVLCHLHNYPTLNHREVALELSSGRGVPILCSFFNTLKLSSEEKRDVVERMLASDSLFAMIEHFEDFKDVDHSLIAEIIIDRDPIAFLHHGALKGFRSTDFLFRLLRRGIPDDDWPGMPEEHSALHRWVKFGGHDKTVAEALIDCGAGHIVMLELRCFSVLSEEVLRRAAYQAARWCIEQGRVDTARSYVIEHKIDVEELNTELAKRVERDFRVNDQSPEALLFRAGVAAWSLYYPSINTHEAFVLDTGILDAYRKLFGSSDAEQLERNASQNLLENLVSKGIPLLLELGWLRDENLESLSTILPRFLESTTGSKTAWRAHVSNLRADLGGIDWRRRRLGAAVRTARRMLGRGADIDAILQCAREIIKVKDDEVRRDTEAAATKSASLELDPHTHPELFRQKFREYVDKYEASDRWFNSASPFAGSGVDPISELILLRHFYQDFGIIAAPELYFKRYRVSAVDPRILRASRPSVEPPSRWKVQQIKSELMQLHNSIAQEDWSGFEDLPLEHTEYLARWTNVRDRLVDERFRYWEGGGEFRSRILDFENARSLGLVAPIDPRLTVRTMKVRHKAAIPETTVTWPHEIVRSYRNFTETLFAVQKYRPDELLQREKNRVRVYLDEKRKRADKWLTDLDSKASVLHGAVVARLRLDSLDRSLINLQRIHYPNQLIEFLCRLKDDHLKGSVVRLALCLGLDGMGAPQSFLDELAWSPSIESMASIVEFIGVQVENSALAELRLGPRESPEAEALTIARKYLNYGDFKRAMDVVNLGVGASSQAASAVMTVTGTQEIIVIPTRGALGELAGYFSDACWSDKATLMKTYPNATALVFGKRPDAVTERELMSGWVDLSHAELLGACFILPVRDVDRNDVLVLRGVNPRERKLRGLDIESFVESLLDEIVVPYARTLGVKKIVAPFDEPGHAQTNRLAISEYLHGRYAQSEYVPLDPTGPSSFFNDRLIFDKCRLLRRA